MSAASEEKSEAANSANQVKPANSVRSGVLVVDKPQGVTSHDVVAAVRHALRIKRVGHAGTLDPMATGILVIGFGSATRLLNYITGSSKTYKTTIRLGASTNTDDADGNDRQIIHRHAVDVRRRIQQCHQRLDDDRAKRHDDQRSDERERQAGTHAGFQFILFMRAEVLRDENARAG